MKDHLITICFLIGCLLFAIPGTSQKRMNHDVFDIWNTISEPKCSNDGNWVTYTLTREDGDPQLKLYHAPSETIKHFARGTGAKFSNDNQWLVFNIKVPVDTLKAQRRRKVKKKDLPHDSLGIFNLTNNALTIVPNVQSFKMPEKWSGWLAYQLEVEKIVKDTSSSTPDSTSIKKLKKENKENGSKLVIRRLNTIEEFVFDFVKDYTLAEKGSKILFHSTGKDSLFLPGVYLFDCEKVTHRPLFRHKGKYKQLNFDESGSQSTFIADLDTTTNRIRPFGLYYWKDGPDTARLVTLSLAVSDTEYKVSEYYKPRFSKDGKQLHFGTAPDPILPDTTLLEEEIVNVEVWSYTDSRLHTQQKVQLTRDKNKTYLAVYHPDTRQTFQLNHQGIPNVILGNEGNARFLLGYDDSPYLQTLSWDGFPVPRDAYLIDQQTGTTQKIGTAIKGNIRFSPQAKYAYWFSAPDTAWYAYQVNHHKTIKLTNNNKVPFYDELNDRPMLPGSYGVAGWTEADEHVLIYDRYDIWKVNPNEPHNAIVMTSGRKDKIRYRIVRLDSEKRFFDKNEKILLHIFDEKDKSSGYAYLSLDSRAFTPLLKEPYDFTRRPIKAKEADQLVFTKQNFQTYPDLIYSDLNFNNQKTISNANPQQSEYGWGSIELYKWISLDGEQLTGLLAKPPNFNPAKKYPMIVNFYEKSSDRLHRHRAPYPGRSTINYSYYTNRGYLIFNPDVPYKVGYPGESAFNAVIPGVTALIHEGFVDEKNIGVQGHSWGGYQIAHLITKTNIFKCAESGAPVVNMFSAYGGIRWGSGLSRMFQYEHTQSRIGGTIWEYPLRYLENSPIFFADKIQTPVLILHNDNDGAVPWYQGIEFFVALRRLGKPVWMLNYNGEPHWPVKRQNRLDFNKRMAQFFDYYLQGAPMPVWMERGIPAIEKGILQGLETKE